MTATATGTASSATGRGTSPAALAAHESNRGAVTAGEAMAQSLNTVAVQISEQTGRDKVIDMARRLGLSGRFAR